VYEGMEWLKGVLGLSGVLWNPPQVEQVKEALFGYLYTNLLIFGYRTENRIPLSSKFI
jgi:hypothetical protein